jgi:hypothetical protein
MDREVRGRDRLVVLEHSIWRQLGLWWLSVDGANDIDARKRGVVCVRVYV